MLDHSINRRHPHQPSCSASYARERSLPLQALALGRRFAKKSTRAVSLRPFASAWAGSLGLSMRLVDGNASASRPGMRKISAGGTSER